LYSIVLTGSAKRLKRNGCTSSSVSGPPRFSSSTPIFPLALAAAGEPAFSVAVEKSP
jgi:hypothetical protein